MIAPSDFRETGWVEETKEYEDGHIPTGRWHLPGWFPVPVIDDTIPGWTPAAKIGSMHVKLTSKEVLDNFMQKTIPLFCDKQ